tara:strand:+ start:2187 stop:2888 length:702 start_codon:yes stop_codon:yes gene_type:complete
MFQIKGDVEQHPFGVEAAETFEWKIEKRPVPYERALAFMESRARAIRERNFAEKVWLLEHPPVYTAGTSANPKDLIEDRFPVHHTGRGGQYTYHGPGQRIAYLMLDLQKREAADLRKYVFNLEQWIIDTLDEFNVKGERRDGRVGIWVDMERYGQPKGREAKIAAIGVRVQKWVTLHGMALNLNPNLDHYKGIVPCGIQEHGVTSLADLEKNLSMAELDEALQKHFVRIFGIK